MLIRVFSVNHPKIRSVLFKSSGSGVNFLKADGVDEVIDTTPVDKTVLLLDPSCVNQRVLPIILKERKKLREVLPNELKGSLASDSIENVFDGFPVDGDKALCFWIDKIKIKEIISQSEYAVDPDSVTIASASWGRLIKKNSDDLYVLLSDGESAAVAHNGNIIFTRSVAGNTEAELYRTSYAFELQEGVIISSWYLFGEAYKHFVSNSENFPPIAKPLYVNDKFPVSGFPDDLSALECASFAAAAADAASGEPVEFLRDDLAPRKNIDAAAKRLKIAISLSIILLLLVFGELELKRQLILKDLKSVNNSISAIYREIFPDRKPVDEAGELKGEIRRLTSSTQTAEILKSLRVLAQLKSDKISRLTEYEADGLNIRIKGEASGIDAVNEFKLKLSPAVADAILSDSSRKPDGTVIFTISGRAGGAK